MDPQKKQALYKQRAVFLQEVGTHLKRMSDSEIKMNFIWSPKEFPGDP
jgi:hypothetical protein